MAPKKPSTEEKLSAALDALSFVLNHLFISHRGPDLTEQIDKVAAARGEQQSAETGAD
jgi:hypothetical protein